MSNAIRFFFEHYPIRLNSQDPPRISRACHEASCPDVWMIDACSSQGPPSDETAFLDTKDITHAVWSTAGVHDAAAHFDDSVTTRFTDGRPLRAVVAALFHNGSSGLNMLDTPSIVGPQRPCNSIPEGAKPKALPPRGLPCLERVKIGRTDKVMTVSLHNVQSRPNDAIDLPPEGSRACL